MVDSPPCSEPSSSRNASCTSATGTAQRSACERCRGQKLRCTRNHSSQASCNRCERAGAQCIVGPALRIGRPTRLDPSSSSQSANPQPPPPATAPPPSTRVREHSDIVDFPITSKEPSAHAQISSHLDDFYLPSTSSRTLNVQPLADPAQETGLGSYDMIITDLEQHEAEIFGFCSLSSGAVDVSSDESPSSPLGLDFSKASSASFGPGFSATDGQNPLLLDASFPTSLQDAFQVGSSSTNSAISTQSHVWDQALSDQGQVPLDQLSRLNLELHQHLSQTDPIKDTSYVQACTLSTSCQQDFDSLLPIGLMIGGLQKYRDLLHHCSNLGRAAPLSRAKDHAPWASWEPPPSAYDEDTRPSKRPHTSQSLSSLGSRGFNSSGSPEVLAKRTHSSNTTTVNTTPSDASGPFGVIPRIQLRNHDRKQVAHILDLPTRMLFLTCYINLIRLCRRVFFNIRQCLLSVDQDIIFARLSNFLISGVSLEQDGHLQIFVLIQVVSRMLDAISAALGFSKEHSILTGHSQNGDFSSLLSDKVATPKLMDCLMREEELSEAQDVSGGGIKALREEILELKKLL
ncbi:MAG: hypothetical protein Q9167_005708 [Letrouitia subvulpina]